MVIVFGPRSKGLSAVDRVRKLQWVLWRACVIGVSACQALGSCSVRGPDRALEDGFVEGRGRMIEDGKIEICWAIKGSSSEL
jgi:hypothetical protein